MVKGSWPRRTREDADKAKRDETMRILDRGNIRDKVQGIVVDRTAKMAEWREETRVDKLPC